MSRFPKVAVIIKADAANEKLRAMFDVYLRVMQGRWGAVAPIYHLTDGKIIDQTGGALDFGEAERRAHQLTMIAVDHWALPGVAAIAKDLSEELTTIISQQQGAQA